jgi:large subunit ribosomal protein L25
LLHADLKRIDLTERMTVTVPVVTQGDPKGVKLQGGVYEVVNREIEIECLPNDIPEQFVINVTDLMIGDTVRASDIPMGGSRKLLTLPDAVISHVVAPRVEETPAATETAAAEPEIVKKGKKEEGGEAEAPKKK